MLERISQLARHERVVEPTVAVACDIALAPLCRNEQGEIDLVIDVDAQAALDQINILAQGSKSKHSVRDRVLIIASDIRTLQEGAAKDTTVFGSHSVLTARGREQMGADILVEVAVNDPEVLRIPEEDIEDYETNQPEQWRAQGVTDAQIAARLLVLPWRMRKNLRLPSDTDKTVVHELQHFVDRHDHKVRRANKRYRERAEKNTDRLMWLGALTMFGSMYEGFYQEGLSTHPNVTAATMAASVGFIFSSNIYKFAHNRFRSQHAEYLGTPTEKRAREAADRHAKLDQGRIIYTRRRVTKSESEKSTLVK